ncbi:MAG TPA: 2-oxoacid:acceptor oxidoreductase family protein [Phycisphaerae bacterium]|nr:2-oxoacid:acceptor oxidoreductase family protein [Phycisphaerae bacterium]
MIEEIVFAGFGGQGILLAGKMLAQAAMDDGLNATWFPSYGPEMRGGTANCTVVYSDDEIGSPIASQYDTAVVMNQPSYEKFQPMVRAGGRVLVNSSLIRMDNSRTDIEVIAVPANEIAERVATNRSANVVIAGAYLGIKPHVKFETFAAVVRDTFGAKGEKIVAPNLEALRAGFEAVRAEAAKR